MILMSSRASSLIDGGLTPEKKRSASSVRRSVAFEPSLEGLKEIFSSYTSTTVSAVLKRATLEGEVLKYNHKTKVSSLKPEWQAVLDSSDTIEYLIQETLFSNDSTLKLFARRILQFAGGEKELQERAHQTCRLGEILHNLQFQSSAEDKIRLNLEDYAVQLTDFVVDPVFAHAIIVFVEACRKMDAVAPILRNTGDPTQLMIRDKVLALMSKQLPDWSSNETMPQCLNPDYPLNLPVLMSAALLKGERINSFQHGALKTLLFAPKSEALAELFCEAILHPPVIADITMSRNYRETAKKGFESCLALLKPEIIHKVKRHLESRDTLAAAGQLADEEKAAGPLSGTKMIFTRVLKLFSLHR